MARSKKNEIPTKIVPVPEYTVTAHSYVEIRYPQAVEHYHTGFYPGISKSDFVKLLPRDEAIEFARAIEQASKEVL